MKQITVELLNEITGRIIEKVHPEKIILFGSHAWGAPGESSDLDLFIVLSHSEEPSYRWGQSLDSRLLTAGMTNCEVLLMNSLVNLNNEPAEIF